MRVRCQRQFSNHLDELLTLKLRNKEPKASQSALIQYAVRDAKRSLEDTTADFRHAASVAAFGMVLRESPHRGEATMDMARELAIGALGEHNDSYRTEFIELIDKAKLIE